MNRLATLLEELTTSAVGGVLEHRRLIEVSGDDARHWLNGQITNDIRTSRRDDAVYALILDARGKIQSDLWVLERSDTEFWLEVPTVVSERIVAHLNSYIIMEDVLVRPRRELRVLRVQGPRTPTKIEEGAGPWQCRPLDDSGADWILDADHADTALTQSGVKKASDAEFWDLCTWFGVPVFGRDFDDTCYPQEAGLGVTAVSFEKGCYLGQETVCMIENRGRPPKQLCTLLLTERPETLPAPIRGTDEAEIGRVTAVVSLSETRALGLLRRGEVEIGREVRVGRGVGAVTGLVDTRRTCYVRVYPPMR